MLIVGTNKTETILDNLPNRFLLIDDGPIIDALTFPESWRVEHLDFTKHTFNPLKGMNYQKARGFIEILNAVFPEGENTLTRKNSNFALLNALLNKPKTLDALISPSKDPAQLDAWQKIETLLLSPILRETLRNPNNFKFSGILLARLDRAALGDFDCFVLANLLIAQYRGPVVIPDFGFYGCSPHIQLMRQGRLMAGVNYLDEVTPKLRHNLLLMPTRIACRASFDDAQTLADHAGLERGKVGYSDYVSEAMR